MNNFFDLHNEAVVLASMLEYTDTYYQAAALGLRPEHFSHGYHRLCFRAIVQLADTAQPINYDSIQAQLILQNDHDKVISVLGDLTSGLCLPQRDVEWHVKQLQDLERRSHLAATCERGATLVQDRTLTTVDCLERMQQSLLEIQAESISGEAIQVKDFLPEVFRDLQVRSTQAGLIGLPTGVAELNEATTGIRPGELWVVGAMPGRGKTALGTQIAVANASINNAVAFFSLEMNRQDLGCRLLCNESNVAASRIRNPRRIHEDQWNTLAECAKRMASWPLFVDDSPSLAINSLIARATLYIRRFGCRVVIVDYVRLIKAPGRELREQVGNITDALRQLAKSEHVAVIALSQLARPRDRSLNGRPTMLALKESGDIEAHAHVVLLIHMPTKGGEPTGEDEIIIAKQRQGPIGPIQVSFCRDGLKFLPREDEKYA